MEHRSTAGSRWGAGEDHQTRRPTDRPTHKDHRAFVRPSAPSVCPAATTAASASGGPGDRRHDHAGWQAATGRPSRASTAGQCGAAGRRRMHAASCRCRACPLPAARSALCGAARRRGALPPPRSPSTPPTEKSEPNNHPNPDQKLPKSRTRRPVSLVRIGGDVGAPSSSSATPWWRPRLRWDGGLPAAIGCTAIEVVAADIFLTRRRAETEQEAPVDDFSDRSAD